MTEKAPNNKRIKLNFRDMQKEEYLKEQAKKKSNKPTNSKNQNNNQNKNYNNSKKDNKGGEKISKDNTNNTTIFQRKELNNIFNLKNNSNNINFGLTFNKYGYFKYNDGNSKDKKYTKSNNDLKYISNSYKHSTKPQENMEDISKKLFDNNYACRTFKVANRMAVGLGNTHVLETSSTLHHIYGVPYIPGQAIKGNLRNWIITKYFNEKEEEALKNNIFKYIFGSEENMGNIVFMDSYSNKPTMKLDIMNPHYPKYYGGNGAPEDTENPNPINFITFNGEFNIYFGLLDYNNELEKLENDLLEPFDDKNTDKSKQLIDWLFDELSECLKIQGFGAKSTSGYGIGTLTEE
ncbi:type III-B CRISPR module RAMP protein Cmr6 [Methanococcus voltae]|uniref:CRISPR-associated RAMP protein, Cmr6 family n=1 Tax=Methanococcus voltae (strain ATCC BAA-1334 / A3) TaxID=456320 RepID=D7DSU9_METV3|nr:type III-B CRISPR module RAMP protein Cmr6 [Methanococcus voltae]MCS3901809.1 CRISPR-associated protein Cmr6 [Methanococcus voltae]